MNVFQAINSILGAGLPPVATVAIAFMLLEGKTSMHSKELSKAAGIHPADVDHVGATFRGKRLGGFKNGQLTITDQNLLDLERQIREAEAKLMAPPAEVPVEVPAEETKRKRK
jgi:hypothetical protein